MKNDKRKRQNIGFIAQDVKEVIPKEFENVINEDNEFISINYGRMCAIPLWNSAHEGHFQYRSSNTFCCHILSVQLYFE